MSTENQWTSQKGAGKSWTPTKNADGTPKYHATENDAIEGYFFAQKDGVGENNQTVYTLLLEDDSKVDFWGTTSLNEQMGNVRLGAYIRVKWNGMKLTKMGATKFASVEACNNTKMRFHDYEVFTSQSVPSMEIGGKSTPPPAPAQNSNAAPATNPFAAKTPAATPLQVATSMSGASTFASDQDLPF